MEKSGKLRCQRFGCDAFFTEDDNPHGGCTYHASPLFHDGMKEWSCCKQRSHDFTLFLEIPGCTVGVHTNEKPVLAKTAPKPGPKVAPVTNTSLREDCSRCKQGFFCSDHGAQVQLTKPHVPSASTVSPAESKSDVEKNIPTLLKRKVDLNEPQVCKNKGCGITFKEKDNHESACSYHPGPALFHDRLKGWKCCNINVRDFDEFVNIPPCTKGWHNANPVS